MGFSLPIIVPSKEPRSPELAPRLRGFFFSPDDETALTTGLMNEPDVQMTTTETSRYRGYDIVPRRQWSQWCVSVYPTRLPMLSRSTLRSLTPRKEDALADARKRRLAHQVRFSLAPLELASFGACAVAMFLRRLSKAASSSSQPVVRATSLNFCD